ncbi:UvrD-helicase domain-containing protein [Flavobacterium tistrianum]|uniref:UvrD-helicase domain-containing protein n=1 Tax=Flavobacterium tistrianum TaxID=1685414 RepID=UPI000DAB64A9|nr:UvrD-helicase domain-containing protein [Flavobacterium tistrianum]KAF2342277.1 UvrD-helicase domain-containing protein [Flavobacterium tistrianum]
MKNEKPKLIIAGAGSGKTTNMVTEIVRSIPQLEPYRFLVAITYTNAATNSIKEKLSRKIKIPPNVFIGTTYAFFNKFLVLPYATLLPKVTIDKKNNRIKEDFIAVDKIFFELDDKKLNTILKASYTNWSTLEPHKKIIYENAFINNLLKSGKIPFDKIASISSILIKDHKVIREALGNRLQFLFVDEFQDASNQQFEVFDQIRKSKKTMIYKVGDAEQFISNFSAGFKDFSKIPIVHHQNKYEILKEKINNRCSSQITNFINNFNTQLQQNASFSTIDKDGVFYITKSDLKEVVKIFKDKTIKWEGENDFKRFYLAYENKMFDGVYEQMNLSKISNETTKPNHILSEVLQIITKIEDCNHKQVCEKYNLNVLQLRILAIKLWKASFKNSNEFKKFLTNELHLNINNNLLNIEKCYEDLKNLKLKKISTKLTDFTTSIHKSKGLEATCVLVVAKDNKELSLWLETDHNNRTTIQYSAKNKIKAFDDHYRLGFVAFSRAKTALYIGCLEKLNLNNKARLENLGVKLI